MIRADLHIHSQYSSDGEFRPADIVGKCAAGGVDLFALTDHNTVRGLDEACDGALQAGLESVPGIEIDCSFEGTDLHLLGYGIDWKSPDFRALEETVAAKVMASFGETVGKLRRLGFAVVRTGDEIEIDIPRRSIRLLADDAEIAARMAAQEHFRPAVRDRKVPASLRAYAKLVSSADKGAVRIVDEE